MPPSHSHKTPQALPLTVWPCIDPEQSARTATYLLTAELAQRIVTEFCPPDGLVVDPFASSEGVVIAAAVENQRIGIGVVPESKRLDSARHRMVSAIPVEHRAAAHFLYGDARRLGTVLADVTGWVDLIVCCPPYPNEVTGHRDERGETAMEEIFTGCARLLNPGGLLVTVTRNVRTGDGRLIDRAALTVALAREAGFRYLQHIVTVNAAPDGGSSVLYSAKVETAEQVSLSPRSDVLVFAASEAAPAPEGAPGR